MPAYFDVILFVRYYGEFGSNQKPHSGRLVCNTYAFSISLSKGTIFAKKHVDFWNENADISKTKQVLVLKGVFSDTTYACELTYQISGFKFLTSFRQP